MEVPPGTGELVAGLGVANTLPTSDGRAWARAIDVAAVTARADADQTTAARAVEDAVRLADCSRPPVRNWTEAASRWMLRPGVASGTRRSRPLRGPAEYYHRALTFPPATATLPAECVQKTDPLRLGLLAPGNGEGIWGSGAQFTVLRRVLAPVDRAERPRRGRASRARQNGSAAHFADGLRGQGPAAGCATSCFQRWGRSSSIRPAGCA